MTNSKNTKRALVSSALAILMCVAMLIGTTFAWFTDTASTTVNRIQAGNLNIALYYKDADGAWQNAENTKLGWTQKTAPDGTVTKIVDTEGLPLWEPGCTFSLPELKIVNEGNLALKYKIVISGITGSAKLNEVIDWTMNLDGISETLGTEHSLAANGQGTTVSDEEDIFTISGKMETTAGNEYQGLSIDGISITVVATQYTSEYDSNDNQYDKDAPVYTVTSETAQNVLDSIEGYAVIQLTAGDYGTLYFRQSEKSELYKSGATSTLDSVAINGANVTYGWEKGRTDVTYMRTLENITIVGCDGATIDSIEFLDSDYTYAKDSEGTVSGNTIYDGTNTDPDKSSNNPEGHLISFFTVKNLTFKDIVFTGQKTALTLNTRASVNEANVAAWTYRCTIDGLNFENCSMTATTKATDLKGVMLLDAVGSTTRADYKNFTITGCTIEADRGVRIDGVENLTITNNTFKNMTYQDMIVCQDSSAGRTVSGNVVISNNTSTGGSKYEFIAIGSASKMNLTITNNTATGRSDDAVSTNSGNYILVYSGTPISKDIRGNTGTTQNGSNLSIKCP